MSLPPLVWQRCIISDISQREGCVVMIYRLLLVKVLHSHNDKSKWDFICLEQHASIGTVCPDTCTKTAVSTYFSLVFFTGRPQPFRHTCPKVWQMLYFSGCSLQIPVGLPLFKLWQKKHWFGAGQGRIYRWRVLVKVWEELHYNTSCIMRCIAKRKS